MRRTPDSVSASLDPPMDMAVELFLEHGERADFIRDTLREKFFGREPESVDEYRVLTELARQHIRELDADIERLEKEIASKRRQQKKYQDYMDHLEELKLEVAKKDAKEEMNRLDQADPVNK